MPRKNYEAKFKTKIAIEAIEGKKTLLEMSATYKIPRTSIQSWKEKLIKEGSDLFLHTNKKDKEMKKLKLRTEELQRIIKDINIENTFLKTKIKEIGKKERLQMIEPNYESLSIRKQSHLLGVSRSGFYYKS